jgi:hypothetical protein
MALSLARKPPQRVICRAGALAWGGPPPAERPKRADPALGTALGASQSVPLPFLRAGHRQNREVQSLR